MVEEEVAVASTDEVKRLTGRDEAEKTVGEAAVTVAVAISLPRPFLSTF